jgi:hypothetical protein
MSGCASSFDAESGEDCRKGSYSAVGENKIIRNEDLNSEFEYLARNGCWLPDIKEGIENRLKIAGRCHVQ